MKRKQKIWYWAILFLLVIVAAAAAFFREKPMIKQDNNPQITFISATFEKDGSTYDADIPGEEIPQQLNDALTSLFLEAKIRNRFFIPPQNYTVSENSVYFTIKVSLEQADTLSMLVNLCNLPSYNSAQFGDTHYHISGQEELYEKVYDLLEDTISVYAVKR